MQTLTIDEVYVGQSVICVDDSLDGNGSPNGHRFRGITSGEKYRISRKSGSRYVLVEGQNQLFFPKRFVKATEDTQDMIEEDGKIG